MSLSELCMEPNPDAGEIINTFRDYSEKGLVLPSGTAIDIINSTGLTTEQLKEIEDYLRRGEEIQRKQGHRREANDYRDVADYIHKKRMEIN